MTPDTIREVKRLCAEVQRCANGVIDEAEQSRLARWEVLTSRGVEPGPKKLYPNVSLTGTSNTGELRRRSMDLTRALTRMRQP